MDDPFGGWWVHARRDTLAAMMILAEAALLLATLAFFWLCARYTGACERL